MSVQRLPEHEAHGLALPSVEAVDGLDAAVVARERIESACLNSGGTPHGSGMWFDRTRRRWTVEYTDRFGRRHRLSRSRTREEAEALRQRLTGDVAAWRLTGTELRVLRGPVVYILRRGGRVLYVGRSAQGLARPLASTHHVLGRLAFDGSEELTAFLCASAAEAVAVEAELILRMRPELNTRAVRLERGSVRSVGESPQ